MRNVELMKLKKFLWVMSLAKDKALCESLEHSQVISEFKK